MLLGLDAGGTKTALLGRCGRKSVRADGAGTNLQRDGLTACADALAAVAAEAIEALPATAEGVLCAGVAGAGRGDEAERLAGALHKRLAGSFEHLSVEVVPDGQLALEAAFPEPESGLVVCVGTGSVLMARTTEGHVVRGGGWGDRIGDAGSGTALGRAALAAIADDFDGGEPTLLRLRLERLHGCTTPEAFIRLVHSGALDPAALAPMVIDTAGVPDWTATRILQLQANALAQRAAWLVGRAEALAPMERRAALLGGLTADSAYREVLAEALLRHLPHWRLVRVPRTPVEAALARASRLTPASP